MLSVVLTLVILTSISFMLSQQSAINTGGVVREHQTDDLHYVALAGYNHAVWQLNQLNCTGYTDIPSTNFGNHSYSVAITDNAGFTLTSGSPANISTTVTHNNGISYTLDRDQVKLYQSPSQIVVQHDAATGQDTYLNSSNNKTDVSYGSSGRLIVDVSPRYNSLLKFDLSSLPSQTIISSAQLELYLKAAGGSTPHDISVHQVTRDWIEGTSSNPSASTDGATWDTYDSSNAWTTLGGDFNSTPESNTTVDTLPGWKSWDVSELVKNWVSGNQANHGFLLYAGASINQNKFTSSDGLPVSNYPKLIISVVCECGVSCS